MSKYKVGDKVLIEGEVVEIDNSQRMNTRIMFKDESEEWFSDEYLNTAKTYEDGLNDAWELARKLYCDMTCGELKTIFYITSENDYENVLKKYTPQEALAKIEAYEESKAIKVGDVVEHFGKPIVVTRVSEDGTVVDGFGMGGFAKSYRVCECKKTDRHIDITSILEQIRGNE